VIPVMMLGFDDGSWSVADAAGIEIVATLLTVKLLVPMSGLEQAVPKVD
jgi:hypothetical protein